MARIQDAKPGVGQVLAGWMHRRNVSPTELARRAQVSRATVYVVLDSRSNNPTTMKQLAIGLATESDRGGKGRINPDVEREAARELLTAIGFGALIDGQTDDAPLVDLPDADQAERILSSLSRDPEMAGSVAGSAARANSSSITSGRMR